MKKYRTYKYSDDIYEVEISRETAGMVFIKDERGRERRYAKVSDYEQYWNSEQAAYDCILEHLARKVNQAEETLRDYQERLARVKEQGLNLVKRGA